MERLFYLQDARSYVGNCLLFWSINGGYTTNIDDAEKFTEEKAFKQHKERPDIDIPIPCDYLKDKITRTVDCQNLKRGEALKQLGLSLIKIKKPKYIPYKCYGCGQFLSAENYYHQCPNCEMCNRP